MVNYVWKDDKDGNWQVASNWVQNEVPTQNANVSISTASLHTIYFSGNVFISSLAVGAQDTFSLGNGTLNVAFSASFGGLLGLYGGTLVGSTTAASLIQQGGAISGSDTVTVNGAATLAGGVQSGSGKTVLYGPTTISGAGGLFQLQGGRTLQNRGTLTWTNGTIRLGGTADDSATIENFDFATFEIQTSASFASIDIFIDTTPHSNGHSSGTFSNAGTLRKSLTTGTASIQAALVNTGVVIVEKGTLKLSGGGSSSADGLLVASGATLSLGGTFDLTGGTYNVAGVTDISGTVDFSKTNLVSFGSQLQVHGRLKLGAVSTTVGSLEQESGTSIDGTGTLTVTGAATLGTFGTEFTPLFQSGTGTTSLKGTTTLGAAYLYLNGGRVLENEGTLNCTAAIIYMGALDDSGSFVAGQGTISNNIGATFTIKGGASIGNPYEIDMYNDFFNRGTIKVSELDGYAGCSIAMNFINTGIVLIESGTMFIGGAESSSSANGFTVASGATLSFGGPGVFTLGAGTIGGSGLTSLDYGTLALSSNSVTVASFRHTSGTLDGSATLTVTNTATLGGSLGALQSGTGTTLLKGATTASQSTYLDGGRTLKNQGTLTLAGYIYLGFRPSGTTIGGGNIVNDVGATLALQAGFIGSSVGTNVFTNAGTLTASTAADATVSIAAFLKNSGMVSVQAGTLQLTGGGTSSANAFSVASGGTLVFGGSTFSMSGSGAVSGTGLVKVDGKLALGTGSLTVSSFEQKGQVDGSGTLTVTDVASLGGLQSGVGTTRLKSSTTVSSSLELSGGRKLQNDIGATFTITSGGYIYADPASASIFVNNGAFIKSQGSATTSIGAVFNNAGTVSVQTGTLEFDRGGTSAVNAFTVADGAALVFHGDNNSRTFTLTGDGALAGTVEVAGGTLSLGASSLSLASFAQNHGTVDGTGTVTINNQATLTGGLHSGTGTTSLEQTTTIAGYMAFDEGRRLLNKGTLTWAAGAITFGSDPYTHITSDAGGSIENAVGAKFIIQSDESIFTERGSTSTFVNMGQLIKSSGTGTTTIGAFFANTGTVSVQTGTLELNHGGALSPSAVTVSGAATLRIAGGMFSMGAGTVAGGGLVELARGTLNLGSNNVAFGRFRQNNDDGSGEGAAISGTGILTITGAAAFTGFGHIEYGSGTTLLRGSTVFAQSLGVAMDGGRKLQNKGTFTWTSGFLSLGYNPFGPNVGGGTIQNDAGATFAIQCDSAISDSLVGTNRVVNVGTMTKSVTNGTTNIWAAFTNSGTVAVQTGTLEFDGGGTFGGTFSGSGRVLLAGGTATMAAGVAVTVAQWAITAGTVSIKTSLGYGGSFTQSGGAVVVGAGNSLTLAGATVLNSSLSLGGTSASRANFKVGSPVGGVGTVALNGYATAEFGSSAVGQTVALSGTGNIVKLDAAGVFGGKITGFVVGDVLDLVGETVKSMSYANSKLTITPTSGGLQAIGLTGTFGALSFSSDGAGGTNIIVTASPFTLTTGTDVLALGPGANIVNGTAPTLNPGDSLSGGTGNDTLALSGGGVFNFGAVTAFTGFETITAEAGAGYTITMSDSNVAAGKLLTVDANTLTPTDVLKFDGSAEASSAFNVIGGAAADTLTGGAGNDMLNGGAGNDVMTGNAGNDFYVVDAAGDKVVEGLNGGIDTVNTALNTYKLGANVERVAFIGTGNFAGAGNALDNRLTGGAGDDRFVGSAGADVYGGGSGTDAVDYRTATTGVLLDFSSNTFGGAAANNTFGSIEKFFGSDTASDVMTGAAAGRFNFSGYGGNDTLTGGGSIDQLSGGVGNDTLSGLAGVDVLDGGAGDDTVTGGAGADLFVYSAAGFGQDTITDFEDGLDRFKVNSSVAHAITDFSIANNGTANVTLTLNADPSQTIAVHGAADASLTLTTKDFVFY